MKLPDLNSNIFNILTICIAIYAAIISTLVFVKDVAKDFEDRPKVSVKMIFGTLSKTFSDISGPRDDEWERSRKILFIVCNKGRNSVIMRGLFAKNSKIEGLIFPYEGDVILPGQSVSIRSNDLELLSKYEKLWFEDHEGTKFIVDGEDVDRVDEEIREHFRKFGSLPRN